MANGKATGRQAKANLITKGTLVSGTSAALAKGKLYYVASRATTGSLIPENVSVGRAFLCSKAVAALVEGDSVYPLTLSLLGFGRDKTLDASKTVQDSTTDIDDESDNISDGLVAKTGTINGYDLVDSPTAILKAMFHHTITATAGETDAADTLVETDISTEKTLVMLDWTGRDAVEGQAVEYDIFPCIFTQMSKGASYNGTDTLNFNFTVCASDDDGCRPTHYTGLYRATA
jgi:hypothetical protein